MLTLLLSSLLAARLASALPFVITIGRGETASVYCYSSMEETKFKNRSCEEPEEEAAAPVPPDLSCLTRVTLSETPLSLTCQTIRESLNLSVLVIPKKEPERRRPNYTVSADDSPYFCLDEVPRRDVNAGHLLSLTYHSKGKPKNWAKFYQVALLPTWEYKLGTRFTCNSTNYTLDKVYSCLQFVPTGWPCFTNCTTLHKVAITIGVVISFLTAYCILCVGLSNLFKVCRSKKV